MLKQLEGTTVAIVAAPAADQRQVEEARSALDSAGAKTAIISADATADQARSADYAGLVLVGSDRLDTKPANERESAKAVQLVREFMMSDKPVAAIGSAERLLVAADVVAGRTIAAPEGLVGEIKAAGGEAVDRPVEVDEMLITARSTTDMRSFTDRVIREFSSHVEEQRTDEVSEQSFPASDPPPGPTSIGGHK